ncbi:hypothetical protein HDV02_000840 [Globomyces sp. JEL0801]|nr:hypothetical protein HDV02_000840 [Globomyces sp. JEL0801]
MTLAVELTLPISKKDSPTNETMDTNLQKVHCPRCNCLIYRQKAAVKSFYPDFEMDSIKKSDPTASLTAAHYWTVYNNMHFENIGFTRVNPEGIQYLICADCDLGPLGFFDQKAPVKSYNIAENRVKYTE